MKFERAISILTFSTKLFPQSDNGWNNLALVYNESGDVQNAIRCYEKALAINPDAADARFQLRRLKK